MKKKVVPIALIIAFAGCVIVGRYQDIPYEQKAPATVQRAALIAKLSDFQKDQYRTGLTVIANKHQRPGMFTIEEVIDLGNHQSVADDTKREDGEAFRKKLLLAGIAQRHQIVEDDKERESRTVYVQVQQ